MAGRRAFRKSTNRKSTKRKTKVTNAPDISVAKPAVKHADAVKEEKPRIQLPASITVKALAELLNQTPVEIIKQLMRKGLMANINQVVDTEIAAQIVTDFGFELIQQPGKREKLSREIIESKYPDLTGEDAKALRTRPPVVTIMGHVDHGKTSLLDAIRQTNVTATEAGGITQHIGAYQVEIDGRRITFLDTPGHEAFTAMRARGAQATDIAILVVAADDGVMPQTIEAMNHAKDAGVPIVVALNKIDKSNANPQKVKQQLADQGLIIEEWGGDVICVLVSAKKKEGIKDLLENLLLVADIQELKANPNRPAQGVVIEAALDKTRGPIATVLVQNGTLKLGDIVVVGNTWGKIKAMFNDKGKRLKRAEPATPAVLLGLNSVPLAGDQLKAIASEKLAKQVIQEVITQQKQQEAGKMAALANLDKLYSQVQQGQVKQLNIILKTDVQGSIEPIRNSLEQLTTAELKVNIAHAGSGTITDGDILLAIASKGIIIGFNARMEPSAAKIAELEGVDIRNYNIIYNLVEDVEKALKGMLEPIYSEVLEGRAEVRQVFPVSKHGKVAGVSINSGKVSRGATVKVMRGEEKVFEGSISSLKRFKDDVKEVVVGFECGIGLNGFNEYRVGDILEFYHKERVR